MSNSDFDPKAIYVRLIGYLGRHKTLFIIAVVFMALLAAVQVSLAAMLKPLVNQGLVDQAENAAFWLPIQIFCLMVARAIVGYLASYSMKKVGRSVIRDLRHDIFGRLVRLPSRFYDENSTS